MPDSNLYPGSGSPPIDKAWRNQHGGNSGWTEERMALVTRLWAEGKSASQIARTLGDMTRNAVIGKLHRMGLHRYPAGSREERNHNAQAQAPRRIAARRQKRSKAHKTAFNGPFVARATAQEPPRPDRLEGMECVAFEDLRESHCRYPLGDPQDPDFSYCGLPRTHGAWCAGHHAVVYQPGVPRADRLTQYIERRLARARAA